MSSDDSNDDLTVEELTKSKSDIFSEHGLQNGALADAAERKDAEEADAAEKRARLVSRKLLLEQATRELGADDPDVEALRADIHDMSEELEAEALQAEVEAEKKEAAEKIAELEALANTSGGGPAASKSFEQKAAALRKEHGLEDEPGRYDRVEALIANGEGEADDPDAEALQQFREKQAKREADDDLPQEARNMLMNLKNMREQAKQNGHRDLVERYSERIRALRDEHA